MSENRNIGILEERIDALHKAFNDLGIPVDGWSDIDTDDPGNKMTHHYVDVDIRLGDDIYVTFGVHVEEKIQEFKTTCYISFPDTGFKNQHQCPVSSVERKQMNDELDRLHKERTKSE